MTKQPKEEEILLKLREAVISGDADATEKITNDALSRGVGALLVFDELSSGMKKVGEMFGRSEIFLSDMMCAAEAFKAASKILETKLSSKEISKVSAGRVLIGTVEGDVHDIGKNLVSMMLQSEGFEVYDIGTDVAPNEFIKKAEELNVDIIALSSLMTSTMIYQRDTLRLLEEKGVRNKYKVMVGGGAVTQEWKEEICADGFGKDAAKAVKVAKEIMASKK